MAKWRAVTDLQDGLVHIRSIAAGRVEKVSDYLDVGDKVWAKVCNVKPEDGKYGLDLRYVNQDTGEDLDPKNREVEYIALGTLLGDCGNNLACACDNLRRHALYAHGCKLAWTERIVPATRSSMKQASAVMRMQVDTLNILSVCPIAVVKSWMPPFSQSLLVEFCKQREVELGGYLKKLLSTPELLKMKPLAEFLGLRSPESPAGLRVVPRASGLELEVTPPDVDPWNCSRGTWGFLCLDNFLQREETFPSARSELGGPVDGYWIEILNLETGNKHRLKREVGTSGRLMQTARVGRLEAGRHCFACAAFNVAGCSSPVSVTVDPAVAGLAAQQMHQVPSVQRPQAQVGRYLPPFQEAACPHQGGLAQPVHPAPLLRQTQVEQVGQTRSSPQSSYPRGWGPVQTPSNTPQTPSVVQNHPRIQAQQPCRPLCPSNAGTSCRYADPAASRTGPKQQETGAKSAAHGPELEDDTGSRRPGKRMRLSRVAIAVFALHVLKRLFQNPDGAALFAVLRLNTSFRSSSDVHTSENWSGANLLAKSTSEAGLEGGDSLWCTENSISEPSRAQVDAPVVTSPSRSSGLVPRRAVSPHCAEILAELPERSSPRGSVTLPLRFHAPKCTDGWDLRRMDESIEPEQSGENRRAQGFIVTLDASVGGLGIESSNLRHPFFRGSSLRRPFTSFVPTDDWSPPETAKAAPEIAAPRGHPALPGRALRRCFSSASVRSGCQDSPTAHGSRPSLAGNSPRASPRRPRGAPTWPSWQASKVRSAERSQPKHSPREEESLQTKETTEEKPKESGGLLDEEDEFEEFEEPDWALTLATTL
eukprot:g32709.t1